MMTNKEMTPKKAIIQLEYLKNKGFKTKEQFEALDIAIKALEQQPCEDCISREDTLNKINGLIAEYIPLMPTGWTLPLNIAKTINELPSVTPQQTRWIPVSERLPEENIHVLCQFYMGGMAECYHAHDYWHIVGGFRIKIDDVLAWMPLPEPYKEGDE